MPRRKWRSRWAYGSWSFRRPGVRSRGRSRRDGYKYMSSSATARTIRRPIGGKRTLQRLRRQAGYRSAKNFAETLGIPCSTYARYERAGDGADCGIPLQAAWAIADALGCSIDLVVGREDIDALEPEDMQSRYEALSPEGRTLVDSYFSYVELGERAARDLGRR